MTRRQKKTLFRLILAAALFTALLIVPAFVSIQPFWVKLLLYAVPYLLIGYDVLTGALLNLIGGQFLDEKFLMALATIGAFAIGEYPEAVAVMLFYQLGELFQSLAVGKSRRSIAELMAIRPDTACVLRDGQEETVSPEEVEIGETILVRPSEKIPLDGVILSGSASISTAALTGESLPAFKEPGDRVYGGTICLDGALTIRSESRFEQSTVARILELVENASEKKAPTEAFITRFARIYTPCVVAGALLLALLPPLLLHQPFPVWLHRALTFLVVSCPCALVVSVPLSFFGGIGRASRMGILVKGACDLETLAKADTFVFDKTGTLTEGSFSVLEVKPVSVSEEELLAVAAAAEKQSRHPIAESLAKAADGSENRYEMTLNAEHPGMGVEVLLDGIPCAVGNEKLMKRIHVEIPSCSSNGTVIHVARRGDYLGHIVIGDTVKPDAADAIGRLKKLGVSRLVMLSGDRSGSAEETAQTLGIEEVHADLLPADKLDKMEQLLSEGAHPVFIGDGVNDAPVLMRADVGVAMGALGSDAAIESADLVLMDDKPSRLPDALSLARFTMRIVRENIAFSLIVKGLILLLGALGYADLWIAVFGDVGVMILAILNALRTLLPPKAA